MPIVTIHCIDLKPSEDFPPGSVQQLADRLGKLFESAPGTTWVRINRQDGKNYAENENSTDSSMQPTFVEILKRSLAEEDSLSIEAEQVCICVAEILSRAKDNVHVIYLPEGAGRVAFGGKLVRKHPVLVSTR